MRLISLGVLITFFAACSQADEPKPKFEAVVIKLPAGAVPAKLDPAFIHYPVISLKFLIVQAYAVRLDQIDGPSWLSGPPYFDFTAKIPKDTPKTQIPAMYQAALAERFRLKVHWEPRPDLVYALVTEKSGVKLKKSDPATAAGAIITPNGHYSVHANTMEQFASILSGIAGRGVLDKTGISGSFDFEFDAEPDAMFRQLSQAGDQAAANGPPSIFTVLHSFGLKLQPEKAEVKHLVVDSVEKVPTEN